MTLKPITRQRIVRKARRLLNRPYTPPPPTTFADGYPNWQAILERDSRRWERARRRAAQGPRVLVATSLGGYTPGMIMESALAAGLTLRGANVDTLLCDQLLPACQLALSTGFKNETEFLHQGPARYCATCVPRGRRTYDGLQLTAFEYGQLLTPAERTQARQLAGSIPLGEIAGYTFNGVAVGEQALAGALRFFAVGTLGTDSYSDQVLRRYFEAALLTTFTLERLLAQNHYEVAVFHHGIYVPQGLVAEVARQRGVRVVTWMPGYRKRRFIFTHNETYHRALMSEPTANWEHLRLSPRHESAALDYLTSRWQGTRDWIWFHEKPEQELATIARELGLDLNKPIIGMLSNVMWDAQLHYPANGFKNMLEWTSATLCYFASRPDLQLVLRIHPAEIRGTVPSRQPLLAEIKKVFPELPPNIFIIPPESPISTYAIMLQCDTVLIYGTKTGVELTSFGIPVIVAGEAWIRNKGLTLDARSPQEYEQLLDRLPLRQRMDAAQRERALKYAYHFFFRRMIPLPMFEPAEGYPFYRLHIDRVTDLAPGRSPGLDLVCDGILTGREFVYPAENYRDDSE